MKNIELVFIPLPAVGHLVSTIEIANLLINRDERLSITVLVMTLPFDFSGANTYTQSIAKDASPRIRFVDLPQTISASELMSNTHNSMLPVFINSQKPNVRDALFGIAARSDSSPLAGLVVDMFCYNMIDVANELGLPAYVFFPSSAAFLGLMFHMQTLCDDHHQDVATEYKDSDAELLVPSFCNPVPAKVLPSGFHDKEGGGSDVLISAARRIRETKGILVNTFLELESQAIKSHADDPKVPPVYPVGPLLNHKGGGGHAGGTNHDQTLVITRWLDDQPPSSVVFLCFGSMGCFPEEQLKEIARALEGTGHRFLWSLRRPPPKGKVELPGEYSNPEEGLPDGFLERTAGIGKVIGWAPQVAVLSHPAIGGFVSHCGWNSTLESLWFGVPLASWPMYAEQQINAFQLSRDLGVAVDIKMEYRNDVESKMIVRAEEIECRIKELMMEESEVRRKVKEMKEKSRMALLENGSSFTSLGCLIQNVIDNITQSSNTS